MTLSKEVYKRWMGYPSVIKLRDWFLLKAGGEEYMSKNSFGVYLQNIEQFVTFTGYQDPEAMLKTLTPSEILEKVNGWIMDLTRRKVAPASIIMRTACVKRFLRSNSLSLDWEKVTLPKKRFVVADKAPSKLELRKILVYAPLWVKVSVLIMVSSGIRVGGLLMLKIKHLDLEKYSDIAVIKIPPEASKAKVGYYTFISPEARLALQEYLRKRGEEEELTPESTLIKAPFGEESTYNGFRISYARTLKRASLNEKSHGWNILRIHTLRKYFRTNLEGTLTKSQIERLMGHVSGEYLDGSYFRPPESDMVEAYRRAIPSLTVLEDVQSEEFQKKQLLRDASLILSSEKLKLLTELLARTTSIDEGIVEFRKLQEEGKNGQHLLVESVPEMMKLLDEGWEIDRELNGGGKFIMKKRTSYFSAS